MWCAHWQPMSLQIRRPCSGTAPFTQHHLGGAKRLPSESTVLGALSGRPWLSRGQARGNQPAWPTGRCGWSEAPAVGGTPGAARPGAAATRARVQLSPTARAHPRQHQGAPEAAGFPVPAPRWPPSPVAGCAGRGLGHARREAATRCRAGVSGAGARAGEVGGSRPGSGNGGLDAACPVPLLSLARTSAAPFLSLAVAPARGNLFSGPALPAPVLPRPESSEI